jgi:hypothetical protein
MPITENLLKHIAETRGITDGENAFMLGFAVGIIDSMCIRYPEAQKLLDEYAEYYNYKED